MKNLNQNNALFIIVGIGTIVTCITIVTYAWLFFEVNKTITQVTSAAEESQLLAAQNAHTQTVRRIIRDTQDSRKELNTFFLTDKEIVTFLEDMENLGVHANAPIAVQSVSVEDAIDKDGRVVPLELTLRSEGTLQQVFYTLSLLETYPKALNIGKVSLKQSPTDLMWEGVFNIVALQVDFPENI